MVDRPRFAIEVHANPPKNLCHLTCVTICGYIARRILAAARVALGPLRCFCSAKRCKSKIIRSDNGYIDKKFWHIIKSLIICIGLILATQKSKISSSSLELELEVQHVVSYSTVMHNMRVLRYFLGYINTQYFWEYIHYCWGHALQMA